MVFRSKFVVPLKYLGLVVESWSNHLWAKFSSPCLHVNKYYILWAKLEIYYIIHFLSYQFVNYTNKSNSRQRRELLKKMWPTILTKILYYVYSFKQKDKVVKVGKGTNFFLERKLKFPWQEEACISFLVKRKPAKNKKKIKKDKKKSNINSYKR